MQNIKNPVSRQVKTLPNLNLAPQNKRDYTDSILRETTTEATTNHKQDFNVKQEVIEHAEPF